MSDKLVKMNPQSNSACPKGNTNAHVRDNKGAKSEGRPSRSRNGNPRNKEKNGRLTRSFTQDTEADGPDKGQRGHRNTKRGRLVNDLVHFQQYRPQPPGYNHRSTKRYSPDYVKEDYVKVSCQFVVAEQDWQCLTLIDSSPEWKDVIQVCLPCEELPTCPICLYPPVCPMSPVCGHAMCYTCALRFVDNCPECNCPICHNPVILDDMKPLKTFPRPKYSAGCDISLKLVTRLRNNNIVCPVDEEYLSSNVPNLSCDWGSKFCNVLCASPIQILHSVILPQEEELKTQLSLLEIGDKECEPYIIKALTDLEEKKDACFNNIPSLKEVVKNHAPQQMSVDELSADKKVYFYQCIDGQPIFLHPLNTKCLIHEYGSIKNAPSDINCKIVAMEHYTQSPDLRSRYRYFSHLPLGTPFILCEADITPFISEETFERFKADINKRAHYRSVKERKENAYNQKLVEKEVTYHCSSYLPQYTEISKPAKEHYKIADSYEMLATSPTSLTANPLSFAEKLRTGASTSTPWINNSRSPVASRYRINSVNSNSSDLDADSEIHAPSFQASFSASLNDAFANFDVKDNSAAVVPSRGKKKKKGKTISLTGGARRN